MSTPFISILTLASGSSGNLALVRTRTTTILLDLGLQSQRGIAAALAENGVVAEHLDAAVVSHAHSDHLAYPGLKLMADIGVPVLMNDATKASAQRLFYQHRRRELPEAATVAIRPDTTYLVGDLEVTPFEVPHDVPTFGFRFEVQDGTIRRRVTVATDLGCTPDDLTKHFVNANAILIEANYNDDMLRCSARHPDNKRRVAGDHGHLSNVQSGSFLDRVAEASKQLPERVLLVHLSEEHNTPSLAMSEVAGQVRWGQRAQSILDIAPRRARGKLVSV